MAAEIGPAGVRRVRGVVLRDGELALLSHGREITSPGYHPQPISEERVRFGPAIARSWEVTAVQIRDFRGGVIVTKELDSPARIKPGQFFEYTPAIQVTAA